MLKQNLKNLLEDLYTAYNPSFLKLVPNLVEKYHRNEIDAVSTILTKYNDKSKSWYDESKDTDDYKLTLIKEYSNGNRILQDFRVDNSEKNEINIAEEAIKIESNLDKKLNSMNNSIVSSLEEKIKAQEDRMNELLDKSMESFKKTLAEQINSAEDYTSQKINLFEGCEILVNILNYDVEKIKLPPLTDLACMGIGSRIIVKTVDGIIGLEIKEILYDITSMSTIEIVLERK